MFDDITPEATATEADLAREIFAPATDDDAESVYRRATFAEPGGRSALRAARRGNPRNLPCPTCGQPNKLTPADKARGYQCNDCADREEGCY